MHNDKKSKLKLQGKLPKLSIQEQMDNKQVIDRMNRKIDFKKNQRHLGQTYTYNEIINQEKKIFPNDNEKLFKIVPQQIIFPNYQLHCTYEMDIKLINNSKYIQRIKILPLNRKQLMVINVKYPKDNSGDIASGMNVIITVRFRPIAFNDFQQSLTIIVNNAVIRIPVNTFREKCAIKCPKQIQCGHCWVGSHTETKIQVINEGGNAQFNILNNSKDNNLIKIGCFEICPLNLKLKKNEKKILNIKFVPIKSGEFKQEIEFVSTDGEYHKKITMKGGAYKASIKLQSINELPVIYQQLQNNLYLQASQINTSITSTLKIRNNAIVDVNYLWHCQDQNLKIIEKCGIINPKQLMTFHIQYFITNRIPSRISLQLLLYNLPQQSFMNNTVIKNVNGIKALQCLIIYVHSRIKQSSVTILPLYRLIQQPIYLNKTVIQQFQLINSSLTSSEFRIKPVSHSQHIVSTCNTISGILKPHQSKKLTIELAINELTKIKQQITYLVEFNNSYSQIFSLQGYLTYPNIIIKDQNLYFGLIKTHTTNTLTFNVYNQQLVPVEIKFINNYRFYQKEYYQFYQFDSQQYFQKKLQIKNKNTNEEILSWIDIPPQQCIEIQIALTVYLAQSIRLPIQLQTKFGRTVELNVIAEVQEISIKINKQSINLRQIYQGNVYNSNKFLKRSLNITNTSNIDTYYEIIKPIIDSCQIKVHPEKGIISRQSQQRLDLIISPIKTGNLNVQIIWKYYDEFKLHPEKYPKQSKNTTYNEQSDQKGPVKSGILKIQAVIKGISMLYYLKDQSQAKRVRQKVMEDGQQSVKTSSYTLKSSKGTHHEIQKIIYPFLENINFYNCQINQVIEQRILIQNDSDLTAEFQITVQKYFSNKNNINSRSKNSNLITVDEQAFTSELGKTYLKNRTLQKSQKIYLSNNKGISIICEPNNGKLYRKQNKQIIIRMFNDTSGRFIDTLLINIKDHEIKKIPIDIHIKGTPVSISRNQLGINFHQEIPKMNLGTMLIGQGSIQKTVKVINNGPKKVFLKWLLYPYNVVNQNQDIFKINFIDAIPGSKNLIDLQWSAIIPQPDQKSQFKIEPKQIILQGREQKIFKIKINSIENKCKINNLFICQPSLIDDQKRTKMEQLALIVQTQFIIPSLSMDLKHKNHINKFQKFAISKKNQQTNFSNYHRKLKLKNILKVDLNFILKIKQLTNNFQIISTTTNSNATILSQKSKFNLNFCLTYDTFVQIGIDLIGDVKQISDWPMQQKIRRQATLIVEYSNGIQQQIPLVGWLYRPWIQIEMPNKLFHSSENNVIDFGTVHVKNDKIMAIYLVNKSKVDAPYRIMNINYHKDKQDQFQQALWTKQDYEDRNIIDDKKCFRLNKDHGIILNKSIPIHYIPSTLALPSKQDQYTENHKPIKIQIMFKPETNQLYKSKFRIFIQHGLNYEFIVVGKGTFAQQEHKK